MGTEGKLHDPVRRGRPHAFPDIQIAIRNVYGLPTHNPREFRKVTMGVCRKLDTLLQLHLEVIRRTAAPKPTVHIELSNR